MSALAHLHRWGAEAAQESRYQALRDDDSEVCDAAGCADWEALYKVLPAAFRTGDWTAFNAELSRQMEAELRNRAEDDKGRNALIAALDAYARRSQA